MLGVGIYFINTVLRGEIGNVTGLSKDVKESIKTQLQENGEKVFVSGLSDSELTMGQGTSKNIDIVIMNQKESSRSFGIKLIEDTGDPTNAFLGITSLYSRSGVAIDVGEVEGIPINFQSTNTRGRVIYNVQVWDLGDDNAFSPPGTTGLDADSIYGSKSFHLVVK